MARVIKSNGNEIMVQPKNGTDFKLKELQTVVGGWIEIIGCDEGVMVVNEEGIVLGLPLNSKASVLAHQTIVGDVLVCDTKQIK